MKYDTGVHLKGSNKKSYNVRENVKRSGLGSSLKTE